MKNLFLILIFLFNFKFTYSELNSKTKIGGPVCKDGKGPLLEGVGNPFPCASECPEGFDCEHPNPNEPLGICCPNLEILYKLYGQSEENPEVEKSLTNNLKTIPKTLESAESVETKVENLKPIEPVAEEVQKSPDQELLKLVKDKEVRLSKETLPIHRLNKNSDAGYDIPGFSISDEQSQALVAGPTTVPPQSSSSNRSKIGNEEVNSNFSCKRQKFENTCSPKTNAQIVLRWFVKNGICLSYPFIFCQGNTIKDDITMRTKEECEVFCTGKTASQEAGVELEELDGEGNVISGGPTVDKETPKSQFGQGTDFESDGSVNNLDIIEPPRNLKSSEEYPLPPESHNPMNPLDEVNFSPEEKAEDKKAPSTSNVEEGNLLPSTDSENSNSLTTNVEEPNISPTTNVGNSNSLTTNSEEPNISPTTNSENSNALATNVEESNLPPTTNVENINPPPTTNNYHSKNVVIGDAVGNVDLEEVFPPGYGPEIDEDNRTKAILYSDIPDPIPVAAPDERSDLESKLLAEGLMSSIKNKKPESSNLKNEEIEEIKNEKNNSTENQIPPESDSEMKLLRPPSTEGKRSHAPPKSYPKKSCAKVLPYRAMCRTGMPSQFTLRWYVKAGMCCSYPVGYCHGESVFEEETIKTKNECEELCLGKIQSEAPYHRLLFSFI